MVRNIIYLFLLVGFFGCSQSNPACDWQSFESLGKITEVKPYVENGDTLYSVAMKFNNSSLKNETQYLEKLQDLKIDKIILERNRIQTGMKYKFTVSEKLSGNCKAPIITFHHNLK